MIEKCICLSASNTRGKKSHQSVISSSDISGASDVNGSDVIGSDINANSGTHVQTPNNRDKKDNEMTGLTTQQFSKFLFTSSLVLAIFQWIIFGLPYAILNVISNSSDLQLLGQLQVATALLVIGLLVFARQCCGDDLKCCNNQKCNDGDDDSIYYPSKNNIFITPMAGRLTVGVVPAIMGGVEIALSYFASASNEYDNWLRVINMLFGARKILAYLGIYYKYIFVTHSIWQRETISYRESLLLQKMIQKLFSWGIFKIKIHNNDEFAYVNINQQTMKILPLDPRTTYGQASMPYALGLAGIIVMGGLIFATATLQ